MSVRKPGEGRRGSHQSRQEVLQLGELNLELAFTGSRTLREDVENQLGTVNHAAVEYGLQIARLCRAQHMVDNDDGDVGGLAVGRHFRGLALAEERRRVGRRPLRTARTDCGARPRVPKFIQRRNRSCLGAR
jgi:hypothetical protein